MGKIYTLLLLVLLCISCSKEADDSVLPKDAPIVDSTIGSIELEVKGVGVHRLLIGVEADLLMVDWGDGKTDTLRNKKAWQTSQHLYESGTTHAVSMKAKGIKSLSFFYPTEISRLSIRGCLDLRRVVFSGLGITTLQVEDCPSLSYLDCIDNQLTELDLSLIKLDTLLCGANDFDTLDLVGCTALKMVKVEDLRSKSLTIIGGKTIERLYCNYHYGYKGTCVKQLDIHECTSLQELDISGTRLSSIDVSKYLDLRNLNCSSVGLTSLDVSRNTKLEKLNCLRNGIASVDVSAHSNLVELLCGFNPLTNIDVSANVKLELLDFSYTSVTDVDLSRNTSLKILRCGGSALTRLDVSVNTILEELSCENSTLISLDVSNLPRLNLLFCPANPSLTSITLGGNEELIYFICFDGQLSEAALNAIFEALPDRGGADRWGSLDFFNNPGSPTCNKSILSEKSWRIVNPQHI